MRQHGQPPAGPESASRHRMSAAISTVENDPSVFDPPSRLAASRAPITTAKPRPPSSRAVSRPMLRLLEPMEFPLVRAAANPMPVAPPVITATLSLSLMVLPPAQFAASLSVMH